MGIELKYQSGFGNHFASEAILGSLPIGQNTPQKVAHGLYAEQISGSSFTAPRSENLRSWLYRIRPSVVHGKFSLKEHATLRARPFNEEPPTPNQLRWDPLPAVSGSNDFIDGLVSMVGNGAEGGATGCGVHLYAANRSMEQRAFFNSDAEMLVIPQSGGLVFRTEMGCLRVDPWEVISIPRGIKFQVHLVGKQASGYVCENFGQPFRIPSLGPIGANGLANPRDFLFPVASFEDREEPFALVTRFHGRLWEAKMDHCPFDVVAWHGNYAPYKYDLRQFQVVMPVNFDHPDPSIFTVLTSPSEISGVANIDFVVFAPRWLVMEKSFRPPYFHRNVMSEFMGLVHGAYDAKQTGFLPGGCSLHNRMAAHGPDSATFEKASGADLEPEYLADTLAFMLESYLPFQPTAFAMRTPALQADYLSCWRGLRRHFSMESTLNLTK